MKNNAHEDTQSLNPGWSIRKQILAAWGGWLLDGYSTIAYLVVISLLTASIFPSYLGYWALVLTLGGMSFGAAARVIGSTILGHYIGDKLGRRSLLTWSIVGFTVFTAAIGFVPSYQSAGILSPVLVYLLVVLAGLFAGAEYGGGASLAMESVRREKRNIVGAFVQSGFGTGYFVVVLVTLSISHVLGGANFAAYGWRYVFIFALVPGLLTLVVRRISRESPVFKDMQEKKEISPSPAAEMVKHSLRSLVPMIMVMTGLLFVNTATFSFYPVLENTFLGIGGYSYYYALLIINFVSLLGIWTGGVLLGNRPSRRNVLMIFAIVFAAPSALFVYLGYSSNPYIFTLVYSIQAFFEAMIFSLIPAFLSENFSKRYRTTAVGISYNSGAIVGGLALVFLTIQAKFIDLRVSWTIDLYIASIVMIAGLYFSKELSGGDVDTITE